LASAAAFLRVHFSLKIRDRSVIGCEDQTDMNGINLSCRNNWVCNRDEDGGERMQLPVSCKKEERE
jgi:hypothetical protein